MKNLTPQNMRCQGRPFCPSVHELDNGKLLIVGQDGNGEAAFRRIPVGDNEYAIIVDRALLAELIAAGK